MEINLQLRREEIKRPYKDVIAEFENIVPLVDQERLGELVDTGAEAGEIINALE